MGILKAMVNLKAVKNSIFAERLDNKFRLERIDWIKRWKAGNGRISGLGISGTASYKCRAQLAYIFSRALLPCTRHKAFTDVGCDFGELLH